MRGRDSEADILLRIRGLRRDPIDPAGVRELMKLLAGVDTPAGLERAGNLLRGFRLDGTGDLFSLLRPMRIAILGNSTVSPVANYLRALLVRDGVSPELYLADFGQYVFDLLDAQSGLHRFRPQVTLCLLDERCVLDEATTDSGLEGIAAACRRKKEQLEELLRAFQERCPSHVVLNTIPLSARTYHAVVDYKAKARLSGFWRELNVGLLGIALELRDVSTLDLEVLCAAGPSEGLCDARLSYRAAMHLSHDVLCAYARECVKVVRAVLGWTRKCLVLDLDNTLWGGVLADDGLDGVKLGTLSPGNVFRDVQAVARQLKAQGVLLAICSKNDEQVVRDAIATHDEMQLTLADFVAIKANWRPKPGNLEEIAKQLNIGTDSLVFLDDSPFERDMVRAMLPEVAVPEPGEDPTSLLPALFAGGWFNALALSEEDRERTEKYQQEAAREELRTQTGSVEEYLHVLATRLEVRPLGGSTAGRLAQLYLRTNQLNMTTRRYREQELLSMTRSGTHVVLGIQASDRFGDHGIVGSVVIERRGPGEDEAKCRPVWTLRNLVLSCRVFSRGIESAILGYVLRLASRAGVLTVLAEFIRSQKNGNFDSLYARHGFVLDRADGDWHIYRHDLRELPAPVPWIKIRSVGDGAEETEDHACEPAAHRSIG